VRENSVGDVDRLPSLSRRAAGSSASEQRKGEAVKFFLIGATVGDVYLTRHGQQCPLRLLAVP